REHGVGIAGRYRQPREVTIDEFAVVVHLLPVRAGIVRAIQAAVLLGVHDRVHARGVADARRGQADAAKVARGPAAAGQPRPVLAAIDRLVEAAFRAVVGSEVT